MFLEDINIKEFKCFKDFHAHGFKRVNLIGGKNNVGKTAFMEACFLINNSHNILKTLHENDNFERELLYYEIVKLLLSIEQNRASEDFLLEWLLEEFNFLDYSFHIEIKKNIILSCEKNFLLPDEFKKHYYWNHGGFNISNFRSLKYYNKIYKKNHPPLLDNFTFISVQNNLNSSIKYMVDELKLNNKYEYVNKLMNEFFNIQTIDIIKNEVMLKQNNTYYELKDFGNGLRYFFNIIIVLLSHENKIIFIDEIENGIHYTLLDGLWETILNISKEQNIQVFATTHSKEMIESFARVSEKLQDKDISFIELGRDKKDNIQALSMDFDKFHKEIDSGNSARGW